MGRIMRLSVWLGLFLLIGGSVATGTAARPAIPAGVCPAVQNTPTYTIVYGSVSVTGAAAPVGAVVEARNPRGHTVGCVVVTTAGSYGMMYVYGEDNNVSPAIPGMRANETIALRVDGATATATPTLTWTNDGQTSPPHQIDLAAGAAPAVAPVVAISRNGSDVVLTWPHASANTAYQVWRATSPYFTPGAGGSIIGDGATNNCANNGVTVTCTDAGALGNPTANHYYLIRAFNAAGTFADSPRAGEFDFALTPGS